MAFSAGFARFIRESLVGRFKPMVLALDVDYRVIAMAGAADYYGYTGLTIGDDCRDILPFLYGVSDERFHLPMIETPSGRAAEVLVAPLAGGIGVLITDATAEHAAQLAVQQTANEIRLLSREQHKLISELERMRDEFEGRQHDGVDDTRAKREFVAGLSHELRAPLAGILGHTHNLRDSGAQVATIDHNLQLIESNAGHLLSLIDRLLDEASGETRQMTLALSPLELTRLRREIEAMFEPLAEAKHLDFAVVLIANQPVWIEVDATRLRQVVINITENAIKFTDEGAVEVHIQWNAGMLGVTICDTGPGIPEEHLDDIFKPFKRGNTSSDKPGVGLGLAISAQLVALMGGALGVDPRPGRGSVFRFSIPAPQVPPPASEAHSAAGARLLLVDDSDDMRALYSRWLHNGGFSVEAVATAGGAWRAYQRLRPDIVLMDLYLGDAAETALIENLRADGFDGAIVVWSASSRAEDESAARAAGADTYLIKPIARPELIAELSQTWAKCKAQ